MTGWRRAGPADADELTRVEREANLVGLAHVFAPDVPFPDADIRARWVETLDKTADGSPDDSLGRATVWVEVLEDPRAVALTCWDADGRLRHLAVTPDRWGEGLAREGVARAVSAIRAGGRTPRLWVLLANHRARGLYDHLGWTPTGVEQASQWPPYPVEAELELTGG